MAASTRAASNAPGSVGSPGVTRPSGVTATGGESTSPAPERLAELEALDRAAVAQPQPAQLQRREQRRRRERSVGGHERVDAPHERRVAQREVRVPDPPAAGEQVERELQRVQPPVARDLLEVLRALPRRVLEALDHGPALELVLDQRGAAAGRAAERGGELDRVLDRELGARADREVRGVRGVAEQDGATVAPVRAADLVERQPHGAVGEQRAALEHVREQLLAERRALALAEPARRHVSSRVSTMNVLVSRRTDTRAPGRRRARSRANANVKASSACSTPNHAKRVGRTRAAGRNAASCVRRTSELTPSAPTTRSASRQLAERADLLLEAQLGAELARAALEDAEQRRAPDRAEAVAARADQLAAEVDVDRRPGRERLGDLVVGRLVGVAQPRRASPRENTTPKPNVASGGLRSITTTSCAGRRA